MHTYMYVCYSAVCVWSNLLRFMTLNYVIVDAILFAIATGRQRRMMRALNACSSLAAFLCILSTVQAFYFPGVAPNEFKAGDTLFIKVGT